MSCLIFFVYIHRVKKRFSFSIYREMMFTFESRLQKYVSVRKKRRHGVYIDRRNN
jgi:hypothetical protein